MFRYFLVIIFSLFVSMTSMAFAAPLLVCDVAPTADAVTQSQVTVNGTAGTWMTYTTQTIDGVLVCVLQDLAPLTSGSYTVTAKFKNAWGESVASNPFVFTKALPGKPSTMGLK